jgi:hypothetical protein
LCTSPNIIRVIKSKRSWAGLGAYMEEMRNVYKILVGKPRKLRRPWCRWEYNIGVDIGEIGWEGVDWIYLAQDRDQ